MTDEPLFAHSEPGRRFTIKELSTALTRMGLEYPTANARVASYAKLGLIHVREKGPGATSPNLFSLSDMAAAVLLSAMQDSGIADRDILAQVSAGIYSWPAGTTATTPHPVLAATLETVAGRAFWWLRVDFYRHLQTSERDVVVSLYRSGEVDPSVAPAEPEQVARLRAEYPDVQVKPDPRSDSQFMHVASIMVPAFEHLALLSPYVAPVGN